MGVAELSLDQRQPDPLVQQLNSMRVAELMCAKRRRNPSLDSCAMQLEPRGAR